MKNYAIFIFTSSLENQYLVATRTGPPIYRLPYKWSWRDLLHVVVIYAVVVVLTKVSWYSYYRRYPEIVTCFIYFLTFSPFCPYKHNCPFKWRGDVCRGQDSQYWPLHASRHIKLDSGQVDNAMWCWLKQLKSTTSNNWVTSNSNSLSIRSFSDLSKTLILDAINSLNIEVAVQFLLDCNNYPNVISAIQMCGPVITEELFRFKRSWCYSIHRTKLKLQGRWTNLNRLLLTISYWYIFCYHYFKMF